ncbi:MAG: DUF5105 domain-containing protein [Clostridium paraputrificum]
MKKITAILLSILSLMTLLVGCGDKKPKGDLLDMSNKLVNAAILGDIDGIKEFVSEDKVGQITKIIDTELLEIVENGSVYSLDVDSETLNSVVSALKVAMKNIKFTTEITDQYEEGASVKVVIEGLDLKSLLSELDREIKDFKKMTEETAEDYSEARSAVAKKYFELLNVKLQSGNVASRQKTVDLIFKVEDNKWQYRDVLEDVEYILKSALPVY